MISLFNPGMGIIKIFKKNIWYIPSSKNIIWLKCYGFPEF